MQHLIERRILRPLPWLALAVILSACQSSRGTAQNTYTGGEHTSEAETYVGNPALAKKLEIRQIRSRRKEGHLEVQFDLHNKKQINLAFEWSVSWFDEDDFRIDTAEHWTPITLGGRDFQTLSIVAPTPNASTWELGVRTPNEVR